MDASIDTNYALVPAARLAPGAFGFWEGKLEQWPITGVRLLQIMDARFRDLEAAQDRSEAECADLRLALARSEAIGQASLEAERARSEAECADLRTALALSEAAGQASLEAERARSEAECADLRTRQDDLMVRMNTAIAVGIVGPVATVAGAAGAVALVPTWGAAAVGGVVAGGIGAGGGAGIYHIYRYATRPEAPAAGVPP
ncbi:MAG: hypothetical protein LBC42_00145, partial [Puniceicoccales bacterium]|nr:hypothetical protein [Puniceicoccales bacterium]